MASVMGRERLEVRTHAVVCMPSQKGKEAEAGRAGGTSRERGREEQWGC